MSLEVLCKCNFECLVILCFLAAVVRMATEVELDAGRTGVVGARLHLGPLADSSNTSLMEGSTCPQSALILTSEPSKPTPGPKPRLTPKPFAVEKNPTIRPILAPKPQPKPRLDSTRLSISRPDPPSNPKPTLTSAVASNPRPVSTSSPSAASRPTSIFPAKQAPKLSSGQTSKPVAQPFKPAPPLTLDEPRKPSPTQLAKKPASAGPAVLQKRGGVHAARSAAEWSGPSRQKPAGSTMTRAKSMGFLTEVGLTEAEQKDGSTRERDGGPRAMDVTVTAPVALRPQSRGGRPRPVSAIFLSNSATPDAQSLGSANGTNSRWAGRRPLSADLTSKFETAGLTVHHRASSKENLPEPSRGEQQDNKQEERTTTRGVDRSREKDKERGSGDGTEDKSKSSATQERGGESRKQEVGEGRGDTKGGGSIKRRISLLLDSSTLSVPGGGRTSADGVETRSLAQPIPNVPDKAGGVRQRIRELTEDTPLSQSPPQKPVVKPRPLPRDFTKR